MPVEANQREQHWKGTTEHPEEKTVVAEDGNAEPLALDKTELHVTARRGDQVDEDATHAIWIS